MKKKDAEKLVEQLREGLLATQDALEKIIATKAWEPLGYGSFVDLWEARLSDIKLVGAMRATVVLALFEDGANVAEVATTVKGVGPKQAKAFKQAHDAGLDAGDADRHVFAAGRVRAHFRKPPSKRNSIRLDGFTDDELAEWDELAEREGVERNDLLREALRAGVAGLRGGHAAA